MDSNGDFSLLPCAADCRETAAAAVPLPSSLIALLMRDIGRYSLRALPVSSRLRSLNDSSCMVDAAAALSWLPTLKLRDKHRYIADGTVPSLRSSTEVSSPTEDDLDSSGTLSWRADCDGFRLDDDKAPQSIYPSSQAVDNCAPYKYIMLSGWQIELRFHVPLYTGHIRDIRSNQSLDKYWTLHFIEVNQLLSSTPQS